MQNETLYERDNSLAAMHVGAYNVHYWLSQLRPLQLRANLPDKNRKDASPE